MYLNHKKKKLPHLHKEKIKRKKRLRRSWNKRSWTESRRLRRRRK